MALGAGAAVAIGVLGALAAYALLGSEPAQTPPRGRGSGPGPGPRPLGCGPSEVAAWATNSQFVVILVSSAADVAGVPHTNAANHVVDMSTCNVYSWVDNLWAYDSVLTDDLAGFLGRGRGPGPVNGGDDVPVDDEDPRTCGELYEEAIALEQELGTEWPRVLREAARMMLQDEPFKSEGCADMAAELIAMAEEAEGGNPGDAPEPAVCVEIYNDAVAELAGVADGDEQIQVLEYYLGAMRGQGCAGTQHYAELAVMLNSMY